MSAEKANESNDRPIARNRPRGTRRDVPRPIRHAAENFSGTLKTGLLDFAYTTQAAGLKLATIDRTLVDTVAATLLATSKPSATARISTWRRALDALPPDVKEKFKLTETMVNPRGKRTLSDAVGTYANLETDMAEVVRTATIPREDPYDEHSPVKPATATAAAKRLLIMAATLRKIGKVDQNVRLETLLDPEMQARYVETVLGEAAGDRSDHRRGRVKHQNGGK